MNSRTHRKSVRVAGILLLASQTAVFAQNIRFVRVTSKRVERTTQLPGEFYPFLSVQIHAKVPGYVEKVAVDRGSFVKKGDLLVQLSAPEMTARIAEAQAKLTSAESEQAQAEAQLAAAESTLTRMVEASKTPGAVAGNDIIQSQQQVAAERASLRSRQQTVESFKSNLQAQRDLAAYLRVTAPFDGVISTRYVHPGALVGPGSDAPLLQLDQISRLRLSVAVPEADLAAIATETKVEFKVPAHPNRTFSGILARPAYTLDVKTRTMPVELDVMNPQRLLAPGMYPSVLWPVERARASLFVPPASIVTTTERVFVIRNNHGRAQWVDVRRGSTAGDLVEVSGDLKAGDEIVEHATDEIRDGTPLPGSRK
ncbi:MAG: efflux RND transporter periplasmic adaptor subunit [Acidobacteriaceae bacterium]|nr:efflux RND transporter periplasmic adaptor subunit [Acidobacteriaceae bacterium]